MIEKQVLTRLF